MNLFIIFILIGSLHSHLEELCNNLAFMLGWATTRTYPQRRPHSSIEQKPIALRVRGFIREGLVELILISQLLFQIISIDQQSVQ